MTNPARPAPFPFWVPVIVSAYCFLAAFGSLDYGWYKLLRWAVCVPAVIAAIGFHRSNRLSWMWIMGILAVVFNPLIPLHFGRDTWQILDVAAGVAFAAIAWLSRPGRS